MKRFVSLILSVCFLFSINTVSYAANISSRKASNPVIQSMNDKYHVDFSGMSIDELNKFIDKMKDEDRQHRRFLVIDHIDLSLHNIDCNHLMMLTQQHSQRKPDVSRAGHSDFIISHSSVLPH